MAGSLLKAGLADVLYMYELIEVTLMYAGFTLAVTPQRAEATQPVTVLACRGECGWHDQHWQCGGQLDCPSGCLDIALLGSRLQA